MTLDQFNDDTFMEIFEGLNSKHDDSMKRLLEAIYNIAMRLERETALGAKPYERTENRKGYANGTKKKKWKTRIGELDLDIPQTRDCSFYPNCIEKGPRSERALKLAVAEMYLRGVSTRRVESITKVLCGVNFTSTQVSRATKELDEEFEKFRNRSLGIYPYVYLDATYLKVRHDGSVIDQAILIAYGITPLGKREILGIFAGLSEAEVHWRNFFESLIRRGLKGTELIISDNHPGLKKARKTIFPSIKWQRCQFHMIQNAMHYAPKKETRGLIAEAMKEIFDARNMKEAFSRGEEAKLKFAKKAPEFVNWLENNIEDGLTCFLFPKSHRKRIRTTNGLERVNREIKRRTRVAVLFPNAESALRLVTGVLIEIHEEWITGKQYLDMTLLDNYESIERNELKEI